MKRNLAMNLWLVGTFTASLSANADEAVYRSGVDGGSGSGEIRRPTSGPTYQPRAEQPSYQSPDNSAAEAAAAAAAVGAVITIIDAFSNTPDSAPAPQQNFPTEDPMQKLREEQARLQKEQMARDMEFENIESEFFNDTPTQAKSSDPQSGACDCSQLVGYCSAAIELNSVDNRSSQNQANFSAIYTVKSNYNCSKVEYYIDSTPYLTTLKNTYSEQESTFGTKAITPASFEVITCRTCKRQP